MQQRLASQGREVTRYRGTPREPCPGSRAGLHERLRRYATRQAAAFWPGGQALTPVGLEAEGSGFRLAGLALFAQFCQRRSGFFDGGGFGLDQRALARLAVDLVGLGRAAEVVASATASDRVAAR